MNAQNGDETSKIAFDDMGKRPPGKGEVAMQFSLVDV